MNTKKILRYIFYPILTFIGFVVIYAGFAYCFSRIAVDSEPNSKQEIAIYIKTNGVHTDIVVPVKTAQIDWSKEVKFSNTNVADSTAQYLAMGWGDKGFYLQTPTWADLKASVAFNAAFGLSATAIHTTFYKKMVENNACKKIMVSNEQYARLVEYVAQSFKKDESGHFINIKTTANYGKTDAFYEANGSYSLLHTCNTWANNALKSCGQKACLWTPFDTGIFLQHGSLSGK